MYKKLNLYFFIIFTCLNQYLLFEFIILNKFTMKRKINQLDYQSNTQSNTQLNTQLNLSTIINYAGTNYKIQTNANFYDFVDMLSELCEKCIKLIFNINMSDIVINGPGLAKLMFDQSLSKSEKFTFYVHFKHDSNNINPKIIQNQIESLFYLIHLMILKLDKIPNKFKIHNLSTNQTPKLCISTTNYDFIIRPQPESQKLISLIFNINDSSLNFFQFNTNQFIMLYNEFISNKHYLLYIKSNTNINDFLEIIMKYELFHDSIDTNSDSSIICPNLDDICSSQLFNYAKSRILFNDFINIAFNGHLNHFILNNINNLNDINDANDFNNTDDVNNFNNTNDTYDANDTTDVNDTTYVNDINDTTDVNDTNNTNDVNDANNTNDANNLNDTNNVNDMCFICTEQIDSKIKFNCNHEIHTKCVINIAKHVCRNYNSYLSESEFATCPICRQQLTVEHKSDIEFIFSDACFLNVFNLIDQNNE